MQNCPSCGLNFTGASAPTECPNCGHKLAMTEPDWEGGAAGLVSRYFRDLWEIMTRPTRFFRRMPREGGLSYPLAFALVTHWVASALQSLWFVAVGRAISPYFDHFLKMFKELANVPGADVDAPGRYAQFSSYKDMFSNWVMGVGSVILDPFYTLFWVLFIAILIYIAARVLVTPGKDGTPERVTFESACRIVCFSWSLNILTAIPVLGWLAAQCLVWIVMVIGAREVYHVSKGRASVIGLFPIILLYGFLFFCVFLMVVVFLKMFGSVMTF